MSKYMVTINDTVARSADIIVEADTPESARAHVQFLFEAGGHASDVILDRLSDHLDEIDTEYFVDPDPLPDTAPLTPLT